MQMKNDFFKFSQQTIKQATADGCFDMAHNRTAALRSLMLFLGKDQLTFGELSTYVVAQFKNWIIANRYPSTTDFLLSILKSYKEDVAHRCIRQVRENIGNALKQIATRCDLSVVPSMYMVKDIYQRAMDSVCVSKII